MTDVELSSTVPSSRSSRWPRRAAVLGGAVLTLLCSALVSSSAPWAAADPIGSAQAEASQITTALTTDQHRLDVVSQAYDAAQVHAQQLAQQVTQIKATVSQDQATVTKDQDALRQEAVAAYMNGTTDSGLQPLFASGAEQATAADEYQSVASGDLTGAIDALDVAQAHLASQQAALDGAETQAQTVLAQVASSRQQAEATVSAQEALLGRVRGRIATLVAQQQAAQAAAAHARFEAELAASVTSRPAAGSPSTGGRRDGGRPGGGGNGGFLANLPAADGAARAVAAAESQIGVPYVWGGESPGRGFDCSGLVQWAWGVAGVGLPRTAAAQYDAIPHIPLSDLEPGDLVFWAYGGGVSHVGMYVGGGNVVDAPQTGQDVQIQPIWGGGLVGAGRP